MRRVWESYFVGSAFFHFRDGRTSGLRTPQLGADAYPVVALVAKARL